MCALIRNMAQCLGCLTVVESTHRHDFQTCRCGNLSVDGGHFYTRRVLGEAGFKELSQYKPCEDGLCRDRRAEDDGNAELG